MFMKHMLSDDMEKIEDSERRGTREIRGCPCRSTLEKSFGSDALESEVGGQLAGRSTGRGQPSIPVRETLR